MRIEVTTIEDFCSELAIEANAGRVYEGIVRTRTDRTAEQDEGISFLVGFWATALIRSPEGEFVLEFGRIAGRDSESAPHAGSDAAKVWQRKVESICEAHNLSPRRGKIEVW